ncbi:hypothetical protein F2Q69_00012739 [Brassica cretica]|uniref:Uncharacterized protein n=1 Tax=Brassica cretica TaxID=69181 RepID=A0A8S9QZT3_BRACR|nr:hypothetical protein F2Q69_00012739 [Brassica cretica]
MTFGPPSSKNIYEATATRQKEFDDMLDKMIKGQEKELMSSFSQMLGIVYTEPNEESETMNAQIEKSDIEKKRSPDFLDLEEFLELELEELLELEEWLEDMDQNSKKKLDDDQNTSRRDLETSPKASIGQHQPDEIDRHPPCIIDQHPPSIIVRHLPDSIDLHPPQSIDRHPLLDELHSFIVETEPIEERMHESEASHNADSKYLGPLICVEEAAGLHKRVKRIHDPVKIVVPCAVVEVEFPIPPDRIDKGPAEAASVDTDRIPSIDTNKPTSIDITTSPSIDSGHISEQKEFDAPIETSIDAF